MQSGKDAYSPQLKERLAFIREGDIIVTKSISCIQRTMAELEREYILGWQAEDISIVKEQDKVKGKLKTDMEKPP